MPRKQWNDRSNGCGSALKRTLSEKRVKKTHNHWQADLKHSLCGYVWLGCRRMLVKLIHALSVLHLRADTFTSRQRSGIQTQRCGLSDGRHQTIAPTQPHVRLLLNQKFLVRNAITMRTVIINKEQNWKCFLLTTIMKIELWPLHSCIPSNEMENISKQDWLHATMPLWMKLMEPKFGCTGIR